MASCVCVSHEHFVSELGGQLRVLVFDDGLYLSRLTCRYCYNFAPPFSVDFLDAVCFTIGLGLCSRDVRAQGVRVKSQD